MRNGGLWNLAIIGVVVSIVASAMVAIRFGFGPSENEAAFQEGAAMERAGAPPQANPYRDVYLAERWQKGWNSAKLKEAGQP